MSVAPLGPGPFQAQYSRSSKACRGGATAAAWQQQSLKDKEAAEARARVQEGGLGAHHPTTPPHATPGGLPTTSQLGARVEGYLPNL